MPKFDGKSFTQYKNVNVMDELRIQGVKVSTEGAADRSNWVLVKEKSDLPAPVGGLITLANNFDYEINGVIDLGTDVIELSGKNVLYGLNPSLDILKTDNVIALITGTDPAIDSVVSNLRLTNPSGDVFDMDLAAPDTATLFVANCIFDDCVGLGNMNNISLVRVRSSLAVDTPNGLSFSGSGIIAEFSGNLWIATTAGIILDFGTAIFDAIEVDVNFLEADVLTQFISAETDSANITAQGQGVIASNITVGVTPTISGVSPADTRWDLFGNNTLSDTITSGGIFMEDNGTDTVVTAANTPVKVAGVTTDNNPSKRWDMPSDNTLRYIGRKLIGASITYTCTADTGGGGGTPLIQFLIYKNGVVLDGGTMTIELDARDRNVTIIAQTFLETDDILELWLQNLEGTNNVGVKDFTVTAVA